MYYLLDKKSDQTYSINFIGSEQFNYSEDKLRLLIPETIKGITSITSYTDSVSGETSTTYLKKYFRYKLGNTSEWSELLPISGGITAAAAPYLLGRKDDPLGKFTTCHLLQQHVHGGLANQFGMYLHC